MSSGTLEKELKRRLREKLGRFSAKLVWKREERMRLLKNWNRRMGI